MTTLGTRRDMLRIGGLATVGGLLTACSTTQDAQRVAATPAASAAASAAKAGYPDTPAAAWERLVAGNKDWIAGNPQHPDESVARRSELVDKQKPFATVVGCIDSRVPPELVFDQGLGDLFVIRTAGQSTNELITGAIEYGPVANATPLIVVLGHERCGAVKATVTALKEGKPLTGNLQSVMEAIAPAYERAKNKKGDVVDNTVREKTMLTVERLQRNPSLASSLKEGKLGLVGAYYDLDTGQVTTLTKVGL